MSEQKLKRLRQLVTAITTSDEAMRREFTMSIPAQPDRDADCVITWAADEITHLRAEVEMLEMQLVGCMTVSLANTRESAAQAREMHSDYKCAAINDVADAVDREIEQRERAEAAEQKAADLQERVDAAMGLLSVAKCPQNCSDGAVPDGYDGCLQCQFCAERDDLNLQHKPTETEDNE